MDKVKAAVVTEPEPSVPSPAPTATAVRSGTWGRTAESQHNRRERCADCPESNNRPRSHLRRVQRSAGNQAIQRLLQAKRAISAQDKFEQEADRGAESVAGGVPFQPRHRVASSGEGEHVEQEVMDTIASPGMPLDSKVARRMGEPFGYDFSGVRVHTDMRAHLSARAQNALAYTVGNHIVFGAGQYAPGTHIGQKLLAHELTHTIQQNKSATIKSRGLISHPAEPAEREAEEMANGLVQGRGMTEREIKPARLSGIERMVQRQPDASPSDAGVPMDARVVGYTRVHRGKVVSDDQTYTYNLLKWIWTKEGESEVYDFVNSFDLEFIVPKRPAAGVVDDPQFYADGAIGDALQEQYRILKQERDVFLYTFETEARQVTNDFLNENEKHVRAEAVRYGISNLHLEFSTTWFGSLEAEVAGDVADNASTRGLAIAAQGLLERKRKADQAMEHYMDFTHGAPAMAALASQRLHSQESEIAEKREAISNTQRDLDVFRVQVETKFPMLADLSSNEDFKWGELYALAHGATGKGATKVIINQFLEKIHNINKVREENTPDGDLNIWLVREIREPTRERFNATRGTYYGKLVDEKVTDEEPSWVTKALVGLLQLGLVLLAPATGGLSLIPAAAISVGTAYNHFKEYQLKKAMRGTDFGAAALSAEDPSLFWLAVDIVGAGFDVISAGGAAFRLFRELAPVARAAREVQVGEDALRGLEREAAELGGKAFAKQVVEDARTARGVGREVGITAEEAREFEQAAVEIAEKELREGVKKAPTLAGGEVSVSRSGGIFSCASPCTMMRERYKNLLAREPKYAQRLEELENKARNLTSDVAGDAARQQVANEAAALERELRTTSLPGDWTSPLKDTTEFNALVERRGSVAAELDHHPTGWSGKDEAKFRYGKDIEAEPGYRFVMDENGKLRYDRIDLYKPPRRYNSATGEFEEAFEGTFIRAKPGLEETRELANLPKSEQQAMETAFKKRTDLIAERDRLEALEEVGKSAEAEKLRKLYAQINERSRQLGENAAEGVMRSRGGRKIYPRGKTHSTSGDFDQVWKVGDEFHLVEAKGGSSGLGSRAVSEGVRAEQGTIEYARSIAQNMANNGATKEIRALGNEILAAMGKGKVKYVLVRAPIGIEKGAAVLRDIKVSEFVIK